MKISFYVLGAGSTIWFLIRVIPKPSRASYPCMRVAFPFMSAFIVYLLSLGTSVMVFRKFMNSLFTGRIRAAFGFLCMAAILVYFAGTGLNPQAKAFSRIGIQTWTPNDPVGEPRGLNPGRVVWVWDTDATNENCTNEEDDYWFDNTDQEAVDWMVSAGIKNLAGNDSDSGAWDALFRHFNSNHGKGDVGYSAGEKIYVKINLTNSCCNVSGTTQNSNFERMDATPEMVLSILKQLVEVVGAAQSDIFIGDPFRTFRDNYWDLCHSVYPDVNYCDGKGMNGRHRTVPTSADLMVFSDGVYDYRIPQEYVDADYFINMPCLKTHDSGGITLAAKNHQGSILQDGAGSDGQSAQDMHYALPENDDSEGGHHRYRHLVDYMGHEHLGDKTLLVIVDGIWAGKSWQGWVEKWQMEPFSNDYPNSIFLSQDLVAIESVCWDFLLTEYASKPEEEQYPYMEGVEDYILQAADPESRPAGIEYDPEGDGEPIGSLGVYEHWNNATEMEYTAIDFIKVVPGVNALPVISGKNNTLDLVVYPNPATTYVFLEYRLEKAAHVSIEWYSPTGIKIGILREQNQSAGSQHFVWDTQGVPEGIYLVRISADTDKGQDSMVKRISIL